jgi:hypothetical protein
MLHRWMAACWAKSIPPHCAKRSEPPCEGFTAADSDGNLLRAFYNFSATPENENDRLSSPKGWKAGLIQNRSLLELEAEL